MGDEEVFGILDAKFRIHSLPSLLDGADLKTIYDNFQHLREAARGDSSVADIYRRLYNLYRLILTMPVPIPNYEDTALEFGYATVQERLEDIKEAASDLGPTDYAHFDDSIIQIVNMIDNYKQNPDRSRAIISEVARATKEELQVGVIITHELYGLSIERFIAESLEIDPMHLSSKGINVIHVGSLRTISPKQAFDIMIFPSYRGGNTLRWIMSGKAHETVIICTDNERRAMLRDFKQGTEGRNTWKPQRTEPPMPLDDKPENKLLKVISDVSPSLPTIPLDDNTFLQGMFDYIPKRAPDPSQVTGPVRCIRVAFVNKYTFLPKESVVTVINSKGTSEKGARDLRPGDIVLFVNHSQSKTIYDIMLDEIKRSPGFEPYVIIIQQWHRRLQSWFVKSKLSYADLHYVLSKIGSKVVGATVASWVRGNTIAPQNPKDLQRLLLVVGVRDEDGSVYKTINDAAIRLRKVNRAYAKAVNAFLLRAASDDRPEINDLLQKYNLDIGTIRKTVAKEEVVVVSPEIFNISSGMAGRLYGN